MIIKRAIEQPLRTLCDNAGVEGSVVVETVKKEKKNMGYNVDTEEMDEDASVEGSARAEGGTLQPVTEVGVRNARGLEELHVTRRRDLDQFHCTARGPRRLGIVARHR